MTPGVNPPNLKPRAWLSHRKRLEIFGGYRRPRSDLTCRSATWAADRITPCNPIRCPSRRSDYTVFLQRLGIPSTDIASSGSYGVYHSVFDNFRWFTKFADPDFVYE